VISVVPASVWFAIRVPVHPEVLVALTPVPLLGSVGVATFAGDTNALFLHAKKRISDFVIGASNSSRDIGLHGIVILKKRRDLASTPIENRPFTSTRAALKTTSGSEVGTHVLLVRYAFESIRVPSIRVVFLVPTTEWLAIVPSIHPEARLAHTPVALLGGMCIAAIIISLSSTFGVHHFATVTAGGSAIWVIDACRNPEHPSVVVADATSWGSVGFMCD
jgi:hypothetical protein